MNLNRNKLSRTVAAALTALFIGVATLACGEAGPDTSLDTPTTRIRTIENIQAVFDLIPADAHRDMMEMMGGAESISHEHALHVGSQYILLTLTDVGARGATITDADVQFAITGPDGKSLAEGGHVMSGKGMHHYAVGFDGKTSGTYQVQATITRGGKTVTQTVAFDITN